MKYIDVIVDNNTDATDVLYTYSTELDDIRPGQKVIVPFTIHNKNTEGYVARVLDGAPEGIKRIKQITEAVSGTDLSEEAMQTALWMRDRFLCRYIEAVKCFLPVSEVKRKTKDPFEAVEAEPSQPKDLTAPQAEALSKISAAVRSRENRIFLLHGVTGSGKTEVYLQAMKSVIDEGRQGIIMVPEISLTPQLVSRFMSRFGKGSVAVLHSKLTPAQRSEQYRRKIRDIRAGAVHRPYSHGRRARDELQVRQKPQVRYPGASRKARQSPRSACSPGQRDTFGHGLLQERDRPFHKAHASRKIQQQPDA